VSDGQSLKRLTRATYRFLGLLGCSALVLTWGLEDLTVLGVSRIWDHGFGSPDPISIFTNQAFQGENPSMIFQDTLTLNLPQLWFSIFYFTYNGILTTMHTGYEWSQFAKGAKRYALVTRGWSSAQHTGYSFHFRTAFR
jgi:hypothetical protein